MNSKFKKRSNQGELMDGPDVSKEELFKNLHELDLLNRFTRGHKKSINVLSKLITNKNKVYHIVDLGCGSGDTLLFMAIWARKENISVRFTGVDMNPHSIEYLKKHCKRFPEISGVCMDYKNYLKQNASADIFHCSLFLHHLNDKEIIYLLSCFKQQAKIGVVINDLIRSPFLYYLTKFFTKISNATRLAKNDGPVSVLRGFKINEVRELFNRAKINTYKVYSNNGFRFTISYFARVNKK